MSNRLKKVAQRILLILAVIVFVIIGTIVLVMIYFNKAEQETISSEINKKMTSYGESNYEILKRSSKEWELHSNTYDFDFTANISDNIKITTVSTDYVSKFCAKKLCGIILESVTSSNGLEVTLDNEKQLNQSSENFNLYQAKEGTEFVKEYMKQDETYQDRDFQFTIKINGDDAQANQLKTDITQYIDDLSDDYDITFIINNGTPQSKQAGESNLEKALELAGKIQQGMTREEIKHILDSEVKVRGMTYMYKGFGDDYIFIDYASNETAERLYICHIENGNVDLDDSSKITNVF